MTAQRGAFITISRNLAFGALCGHNVRAARKKQPISKMALDEKRASSGMLRIPLRIRMDTTMNSHYLYAYFGALCARSCTDTGLNYLHTGKNANRHNARTYLYRLLMYHALTLTLTHIRTLPVAPRSLRDCSHETIRMRTPV